MDLKGKRTLVTGAGRGIGREIALHLSSLGAEVYALSKTKSRLESLQEEDPKIKIICVDISDWDATRKAVKQITPIQLLVNNASVFKVESFLETTADSFDEMFAVNIKGPVNITQVVVSDLVAREMTGNVVNVSSDSALSGFADSIVYNMSKAALDNFTKCAVVELSRKGIRLNCVNPTLVLTEMGKKWLDSNEDRASEMKNRIPARRFVKVSDVTKVVAFLLSDDSSMVNGHSLAIDGGFLCGHTFIAEAK